MPSLAEECCKLGIELMQKHDDPDVRKAAFGLFGAVVSGFFFLFFFKFSEM